MKLIRDFYIVDWREDEIEKFSNQYGINIFVTFNNFEDIRKTCVDKVRGREMLSSFWKFILEDSGFLIDPYPYIPKGIWRTKSDDEIWDFCQPIFKDLLGKSIVRFSSRLKEPDALINVIRKQNFEQLVKNQNEE